MVVPASHRVSVPCGTQDTPHLSSPSPTGLSPPLVGFPKPFGSVRQASGSPTTPACAGLGSSAFARHYSQNPSLFLGLLRCFSSSGSLPSRDDKLSPAGFPHSDIVDSYGCTRLIHAFRSVPRPSSALDAKASPVCSYPLLSFSAAFFFSLLRL